MEDSSKDARMFALLKGDVVAQMNKYLQEITGSKKYRIPKSKAGKLQEFAILWSQFESTDFELMDHVEKKQKANEILKDVMHIIGQKENHPIDMLIRYLNAKTTLSKDEKLLTQTKFYSYKESAIAIARKVNDAGKLEHTQKLYTELSDQELAELLQQAEKTIKQIRYLGRAHNRITPALIDRYHQAYSVMCTYMEKIVRFLIGIQKILANKTTSYLELRETPFGSNLNLLKEQPHFRDLVAPIDHRIRNAFAHGSVLNNPANGIITFIDRSDSLTLKYDDFVQQTRELTAVLAISSNIDSLILYPAVLELREYLK